MMRFAVVACTDAAMLPAAVCCLRSIGTRLRRVPAELFLATTGLSVRTEAEVEAFFAQEGLCVRLLESTSHELPDRVFGRFSQATLMRLTLDRLLPADLDRVLFVDADMLAQRDVGPLLLLPLAGKTFGAVEDLAATGAPPGKIERMPAHRVRIGLPRDTPYFNAGCLLMDWRATCASGLLPRAMEMVIRRPDLPFLDQDALNLAGQHEWLSLEPKWNLVVNRQQDPGSAALVHFAGARKPWRRGAGSARRAYAPIYERMLTKSPWRGFCDPLDSLEAISTALPRLRYHLSAAWRTPR